MPFAAIACSHPTRRRSSRRRGRVRQGCFPNNLTTVSNWHRGNASSRSFVVTRYDAAGRAVFTSYPVASLTSVNDTLTSMRTFYDALNRVIRTEQDDQGSMTWTPTNPTRMAARGGTGRRMDA